MHTITLKSDDDFFEMLNAMAQNLDTSRSDLIRKSVIYYKEALEKEKLKVQIKKASLKVRNESLKIAEAFEDTVEDGL